MKLRLILISCFLSIVPLFLVQTYQYFKEEKSALNARERDNLRELKSSSEDVKSILATSLDTVSLLSQLSLSSVSLEYNRPEALNEYLTLSNKRNNHFSRIAVFDANKEFFTSTGEKNVFDLIENAQSAKDVAQELQLATVNELITFRLSNGSPTFFVASKIFSGDKTLVGFLIGELDKKILGSHTTKLSSRLKSTSGQNMKSYFAEGTVGNSKCIGLNLANKKNLSLCFNEEKLSPWFWLNSSSITLVIVLCVLVLVYFVLYSYFIGRILKPLYRFLDNITGLTKGEFSPQSANSKYSEINKLIEASNIIGQKLQHFQEIEIERTKNEAVAKTAEKVAHDIRSPLTSLEFIVKNIGANLAEKERITANQALERISDILRTLGGRKSTEDQTQVKVEIVDPLVKRIISEKRLEFKTKNNIEMRLHNNIPYGTFVTISKAEFYRTISNLINNSAEAAFPDKKLVIDITLSQFLDDCIITIKDNGRGIPSDALSLVFQHGVSFGKDSGSGIGLTSAKETIEKYKGALSLNSEEGKGTVVTIKLPIVSAPRWFKTALKITTSNVCIIDDDDSIHSIWDEILSGKNLSITHIKSSNEFELWFRGINKSDYSFLFDLELLGSKMNGLDLIKKFNLEARSTLVTSHYDDKSVQNIAQKLGVKIIPKDSASRISIDLSPVSAKKMVLIDDDNLIHLGWEMCADKKQVDLASYFTIDDFLRDSDKFSKDTAIYIDSNLKDGVKGEIESKKIFDLGFENLILASGLDFQQLPYWIKGNQGKAFPLE
ncbi:hybrid sensor histidine kinase/response regulator [Candidatus Dojkabacteria bacterium]|uniref:histidine kinase n=1 Tax=Candidatus Dojkabacteria bacterium TaxID=2099670 RepID=A0A5C7J8S4_9BACT|nr:MAG: hybrid sensor histidine kinase/response regulator [Candidatus Dojkabacteria bacterium]